MIVSTDRQVMARDDGGFCTSGALRWLVVLCLTLAVVLISVDCLTGGIAWAAGLKTATPTLPGESSFALQLRASIDFVPEIISMPTGGTVIFPAISVKTVLIGLHLVGLVLGFGSAVFLDLYLVQYLWNLKLEPHTVEIARFGSKIVSIGLLILWLSGLGFLALYYFDTPEKLANPKIWSKVTIVSILTLNGLLIHRLVLEKLATKHGQLIMDNETDDGKSFLLISGSVSFVSWATAMTFGFVKELNGVISAQVLLSGYVLAIVAVYLGLKMVMAIMVDPEPGFAQNSGRLSFF